MPDLQSLTHKPSQISLRMEDISQAQTIWPKFQAILDIEPQDHRSTLERWTQWLPGRIDAQLAVVRDEDSADDESAFSILFELRAIWSLLQIPPHAVIGARKRLFGSMPPADENGDPLFSWYELHLITAAFWYNAPARETYMKLVRSAEAAAKRAKEVNSIFDGLRDELSD